MTVRFRIIGWLFLISCFDPGVLRGQEMGVEWYESFFQESQKNTTDKALSRVDESLREAVSRKDKLAETQALNELGLIHLTRTFAYEKAIDFFIRALAIEDSLELKERQIFTYLAIAQVFEEVGDYYKSAQFLKTALAINATQKNAEVLALILNELGKINAANGNIDSAFENYKEVLSYKDDINKPGIEAAALFNMAHLFTLQGKYNEALSHHKRALAIRRAIKNRKDEATSLNAIGELYRLMKNDEKALANHVVALEIRQALEDTWGEAESYNNIGVLYYQQKKIERAAANLQLGLKAGLESDNQHQIRKSYEYLGACYEAAGDFKKALESKDHFFEMSDMIQREVNDQKLLEKQNLYIIGKKEAEIGKLEVDRLARDKELADQKRFRNFLIALIALSLIIVALVYYLYVLQQRSNRSLRTAHEQPARDTCADRQSRHRLTQSAPPR